MTGDPRELERLRAEVAALQRHVDDLEARSTFGNREREEMLRLALQGTGAGLWTADAIVRRATLDAAARRLLALDDGPTVETDLDALVTNIHPEDFERVMENGARAAQTGVYEDIEYRVTRDGETRWVLSKAAVFRDAGGGIRFAGALFDVTGRRLLEEQQRHLQKMEALGGLTTGLAHNFNNLVAGILTNVEMAMHEATGLARGALEDARDAAVRAADLVQQLARFAGRGTSGSKRADDVGAIVRRTVDICSRSFDKRVAVELAVAVDLPPQPVVSAALEQAMLNLMINAREAIERAPGRPGYIRVSLETIAPDDLGHALRAGARPAPHARIRVQDNGVGMSDEARRRAFEPFFTTKDVGKGTGLGLATTWAIVRDHGGWIECESELGAGSTFSVFLPLADVEVPAAARAKPAYGRGERILLVDDEAIVRRAIGEFLVDSGYEVVEAPDGVAALDLFRRPGERYDLVILDQSMPGLSGRATLQALRETDPAVRVVGFSGSVDSAEEFEGLRHTLAKPANVDTLLRVIRDALDAN